MEDSCANHRQTPSDPRKMRAKPTKRTVDWVPPEVLRISLSRNEQFSRNGGPCGVVQRLHLVREPRSVHVKFGRKDGVQLISAASCSRCFSLSHTARASNGPAVPSFPPDAAGGRGDRRSLIANPDSQPNRRGKPGGSLIPPSFTPPRRHAPAPSDRADTTPTPTRRSPLEIAQTGWSSLWALQCAVKRRYMNLKRCRGTRNVLKASFRRRSSMAGSKQFAERGRFPLGGTGLQPGVGQVVERLARPLQRADEVLLVEAGPLVEIAVLAVQLPFQLDRARAASRPGRDASETCCRAWARSSPASARSSR